MNKNPSIQERKEWWDDRIDELVDLVINDGYRLKDLSDHFDKSVGSISAILHRRGISLVLLRHKHKRGK